MATEVFRVEKTRDYTVISNHHLRDTQLSLKAKGLLSQMLSLSEEWEYSIQGLARINKEGTGAIREAIRELERCGYVERRQGRDARGRLAANEYTIYECPQHPQKSIPESTSTASPSPSTGNPNRPPSECPALENPLSDTPSSENPLTDNPLTDNPSSENLTQLSTNVSSTYVPNTDKSSTDLSIHPSIHPTRLVSYERKNQEREIPVRSPSTPLLCSVAAQRQSIRRQIDYDALLPEFGAGRLGEVVELMLEIASARGSTIRVAGGEYPTEYVQDRLLGLNALHVQYVFSCIDRSGTDVANIKAYLLTALFNAAATMDSYYRAEVRRAYR